MDQGRPWVIKNSLTEWRARRVHPLKAAGLLYRSIRSSWKFVDRNVVHGSLSPRNPNRVLGSSWARLNPALHLRPLRSAGVTAGFRNANIVWHKVRKDGGPDGRGVGFYFRNVTELILFGIKGKNARTPAPGRRQVNYLATRKREHSLQAR